ncbi:MAG: hypothetical protein O2970_11540 [Proteobacteria bacterium]|nr:hypothetical protein [Pseudomonadota bacterium]
MTKFEKGGTIFLAIVAIAVVPLVIDVYSQTVRTFINYLSNGKILTANVVSSKTRLVGRSYQCDINYIYNLDGKKYSGHDSIYQSCYDDMRYINIFYNKEDPKESVIGFNPIFLSFPIIFIFIPLFFIKKYRDSNNRIKFCLYYLAVDVIFLTYVSAVIAFYILHPIAIAGWLSIIILILFVYCSAYSLFKNFIKYILYKKGEVINGKITETKDGIKIYNDSKISYRIYYTYDYKSKKYSGNETVSGKEYATYKVNDVITILYCPSKPYFSCINI